MLKIAGRACCCHNNLPMQSGRAPQTVMSIALCQLTDSTVGIVLVDGYLPCGWLTACYCWTWLWSGLSSVGCWQNFCLFHSLNLWTTTLSFATEMIYLIWELTVCLLSVPVNLIDLFKAIFSAFQVGRFCFEASPVNHLSSCVVELEVRARGLLAWYLDMAAPEFA